MSHLMLDLASVELTPEEASVLQHPAVGGLILFSRNYQDREQLIALIRAVRSVRSELLIAVDHEGGRYSVFERGLPKSQPWAIYCRPPQARWSWQQPGPKSWAS